MNKEEAKKIFGENLKRMRIAKGLSQEELALKLGYTNRSSINKIEVGKNDMPRNKIAMAAQILGISPLEFFKSDMPEVDLVTSEGTVIEINKLNDINKAKLEAYYQALLDSQGGN